MNFEDWWRAEGRFIDPDTTDVSWFDKREGLAQAAFAAGEKAMSPEAANARGGS